MRARCPVCQDRGAPLADGDCRRCAGRLLVAQLLALVPAGSLAERVDRARYIVQEALVANALAESDGSRTGAATLLGVPDTRVADYLRRYPWLARRWPGKRGRPPKSEEE